MTQQTIKAWSFSSLGVFEKCRHWAKLKQIDKIPEPPRDENNAADRGTRIHQLAEDFVRGKCDLAPELQNFSERFEKLKALFAAGMVTLEEDWAVDNEWVPTEWTADNAWMRAKLDALVIDGSHAVVIDYKTGKKLGNEVKHAEQGQLYQLLVLLRFPQIETVSVEFWYIDKSDITLVNYTREKGLKYYKSFDKRGNTMTSTTIFPPNPNKYSCQWCPYSPRGNGHCERGI